MAALDDVLAAHARAAAVQAAELVLEKLPEVLRQVLAEQQQSALEPLEKIIDCSTPAAYSRTCRDAELRALGHRVGRRLLFRRIEVLALFAARERDRRGTRLRAVGGAR